jgi:hypothetical protein
VPVSSFDEPGVDHVRFTLASLRAGSTRGWRRGAPALALAVLLSACGGPRSSLRLTPFDDGLPRSGQWRGFAIADLDRDGEFDLVLVAMKSDRRSPVFLGDGRGRWRATTAAATPSAITADVERFGSTRAVGDFDGDGGRDLAVARGTPDRNDVVALDDGRGSRRFEPVAAVPRRAYVRAVHAADLDADGRDELLIGYARSGARGSITGMALLDRSPRGRWRRRWRFEEPGRLGVSAIATGDVDGDSALDVVALAGDGRSWLLLGDGRGGFVPAPARLPGIAACAGMQVEAVDLDHDGGLEVVAGFADASTAFDAAATCPSGGGVVAWKVHAR